LRHIRGDGEIFGAVIDAGRDLGSESATTHDDEHADGGEQWAPALRVRASAAGAEVWVTGAPARAVVILQSVAGA
jgi:hypothetical protein